MSYLQSKVSKKSWRFAVNFGITFGFFGFWHCALYLFGWSERPFLPNRRYRLSKVIWKMSLSLVRQIPKCIQGDPQHVLLHHGRGPVHRLGGDLPPLLRHQPPALPQRRTGFYKVKKVFSSPWFQLLLARPSRALGTRQCSSSRRSGFPSTASSTSTSPTGSSTSRS